MTTTKLNEKLFLFRKTVGTAEKTRSRDLLIHKESCDVWPSVVNSWARGGVATAQQIYFDNESCPTCSNQIPPELSSALRKLMIHNRIQVRGLSLSARTSCKGMLWLFESTEALGFEREFLDFASDFQGWKITIIPPFVWCLAYD